MPNDPGDGRLWCLKDLDSETLEPVQRPRELSCGQSSASTGDLPPLLFIHGVEFSGPAEAMRDLVNPMLTHLGRDRVRDRRVYIFSWNSLIVPRPQSQQFFCSHPVKRAFLAMQEVPKCHRYLNDVERRARDAATGLVPFIAEWNGDNRVGPTVISHSMGNLVWVVAMNQLLQSSTMLARPGVWWSLQPAMPRNCLTSGGEFGAVAKLYTGHESARAMIWYSRLDFILSSLYLFSKPGLALGQWGCPEGLLPQRDITNVAGEAHGMSHLARLRGDFFRRVSHMLPAEAKALGII